MWVRIDDRFTTHPKILVLSMKARWLYLECLCYSAGHLTDGKVPSQLMAAHRRELAELLHQDLLSKDGDSYLIHDWLDWNPSRQQVMAKREADRERLRIWREKRREQRDE
jgi:hypothetical protein